MNELTTEDLRGRIEDAEARNAERASGVTPVKTHEDKPQNANSALARGKRTLSDAGNTLAAFTREHPALAIAGGVVAGLAIASLFKGPRRLAAKGGAKAAGLAALGGEMALAYALDAYNKAQDAGREGARRLEDMSDNVGDTARKVRREATYRAGTATDTARISARETTKAIARKFGRG